MKVTGPSGSGAVAGSGAPKRAGESGFSLDGAQDAQGPASVARTAAAGGVSSLDALLALQAAPDPIERRRRAVRRAGRLLDILDEVKLAMLDGRGSGAALERLQGAIREARDGTEDPRLEGVLDEIETRAAVELAKQEVARAAA